MTKKKSKIIKRIIEIIIMCVISNMGILYLHLLYLNDLKITLTIIATVDLLIILFGDKVFKLLIEEIRYL